MPIFQDPDRRRLYSRWSDDYHSEELGNQEGLSTWGRYHEDNQEPDSFGRSTGVPNDSLQSTLASPKIRKSDREELIRYIKNADPTAWAQPLMVRLMIARETRSRPSTPVTSDESSRVNHPSGGVEHSVDGDNWQRSPELASPADIERPRSALHSGDFREGVDRAQTQHHPPQSPIPRFSSLAHGPQLGSSPTTPWFSTPVFTNPSRVQESNHASDLGTSPGFRPRAPSLSSFSSSYVLKAPTSPLVHQANNTDLDFSLKNEFREHPADIDKVSRRRTLPPETFREFQSSSPPFPGAANLNSNHLPRGFHDSSSFRAHQPRKSLTSSYSLQLASSVQSPAWRTRRPSLASEASSKAHAPMVGSYEESILRGRMSMNPSKPLDFTAQIGVLGRGTCKSSLRCPPHATVPFPAVFYSYPTSGSGRSIEDDNPSPYVGLIDLENSLPKDTSTSNRRRRYQSPARPYNDQIADSGIGSEYQALEALRRREKRSRRTEPPKCPTGGCYRIPQQGQLQIMIKNPNKTAVKLFLVPYDLTDMEPGTKTFIRQRSYSAGPIIDMPLNARKNYGTDRPEASLNASEDPGDKPILRYLIHLNICCPSRGRYYLYSSVRVVFANRVPDGKEKLRNEIQYPDPRYTPYKQARETNPTHVNARPDKGYKKPATDMFLQSSNKTICKYNVCGAGRRSYR
ncbi:uncharacterized protein ACLA_022700 [Aspergillus clavatus NRRL 1]|uniref:Atos-like conserved domain-containing protein n=1 Tax=Aspergillus clavatus (strain ATCC 1007 / CBS 513.65 / DSM 816 / NCTC 3887 / NRRL 1 / QM 1276 / 107) TaxID=344612 RepID=A1CPI5_ASPCL|nr:uncharacterized protein ACLA_022700 [Aspergillus clavatus NRRL 1]EAW07556.1 conserved hypothetical protein [Aspergillus clavatus NRRL 1]